MIIEEIEVDVKPSLQFRWRFLGHNAGKNDMRDNL